MTSVTAPVFFPGATLVTFKHLRDWGLHIREVREVDVRTRYKFWFSLQSPRLLSS